MGHAHARVRCGGIGGACRAARPPSRLGARLPFWKARILAAQNPSSMSVDVEGGCCLLEGSGGLLADGCSRRALGALVGGGGVIVSTNMFCALYPITVLSR